MIVDYYIKVAAKKLLYRIHKWSEVVFRLGGDRYDFQTIDLLKAKLKKDSNCIDIGANAGHILQEILKYAPRGKHYAFEPLPHLNKFLKNKFGKKVQVFDYALSDNSHSSVEFSYYENRPAVSGFKERASLPGYTVKKLTVQTMKLDDVIPADVEIDLIKIDVEGAEYLVFQGAKETLIRNKPIVLFECGPGGADEYNSTPEQIFDLLSGCGLQVSVIEYYLKGNTAFTRDEFVGQFYKGYNYFFVAYPA